MLKWAIIFALVSLVAGVLGFGGVAAGAAGIAALHRVTFAAELGGEVVQGRA